MPVIIKSHTTRRFNIELIKLENDEYIINWDTSEETWSSNGIKDLNTAMKAYDELLIDLEGN
jgi:hypothetical protein